MDLDSLVMLNTLVQFLQHPNIIVDSLEKEEEIRCIFESFTSPSFFPAHYSNVCHQNLFHQNKIGQSTHYMPNLPGIVFNTDTMEANIPIECKTSLLASIHSFCTLKNAQNMYCYLFLANYPSQAKCFQQVAIFCDGLST